MSRRIHRTYGRGFHQTYLEFLLDNEGTDKITQNDVKFLRSYREWEKDNSTLVEELDKYVGAIVVLARDYSSADGKVKYPVGLRLHVIMQVFGQLLGLPIYVQRKAMISYATSKKMPMLLRPDFIVVDRRSYVWK